MQRYFEHSSICLQLQAPYPNALNLWVICETQIKCATVLNNSGDKSINPVHEGKWVTWWSLTKGLFSFEQPTPGWTFPGAAPGSPPIFPPPSSPPRRFSLVLLNPHLSRPGAKSPQGSEWSFRTSNGTSVYRAVRMRACCITQKSPTKARVDFPTRHCR